MGALVAAVNKKGKNVVPNVAAMLKELSHRGKDAYGIATPKSATTAKAIEGLGITNCISNIALGHSFSRTLPRDQPQPVQGKGFAFVFEGRLFPSTELLEANEIIQQDLSVTIGYLTREDAMKKPELARLAVGLPKDLQEFRIVRIGEIDEQVDGGTHISHLKEIGTIELTKTVNKGAKNRRMYFILKED